MCLTDILSVTFPFQLYPFPLVGHQTLGFGLPLSPMLSRMISARNARTLNNTKPVPEPIRALAFDLTTHEKRSALRMARSHVESASVGYFVTTIARLRSLHGREFADSPGKAERAVSGQRLTQAGLALNSGHSQP